MQASRESGIEFVASPTNQWTAVALVAIGAFTIVTCEFLPVGILTQLSSSFQQTEGKLGLAVTLPGLLAALTAPVAVFFSGTIDRKYIVTFLSFLTAISCLICATSNQLIPFLLGRALLGLAIGGFWSFAIVIARRLVTSRSGHRATAIVGAGISLGTIFGLPFGSFAESIVGWRGSFLFIAGLAALVGTAQIYFLPSLKASAANALSDVAIIFKIPKARQGFLIMAISVAGHFAAYTYLEPYLHFVAPNSRSLLTFGLLLFGVCGFFGTFAPEIATKRFGSWATFLASTVTLFLMLSSVAIIDFSWSQAFVVIGIWGFIWGLMPTLFNIWLFEAAPKFVESASGIFVFTVQFAVGIGSFLGGQVFDRGGLKPTFGFSAAAFASVSLLLLWFQSRKLPYLTKDTQALEERFKEIV